MLEYRSLLVRAGRAGAVWTVCPRQAVAPSPHSLPSFPTPPSPAAYPQTPAADTFFSFRIPLFAPLTFSTHCPPTRGTETNTQQGAVPCLVARVALHELHEEGHCGWHPRALNIHCPRARQRAIEVVIRKEGAKPLQGVPVLGLLVPETDGRFSNLLRNQGG